MSMAATETPARFRMHKICSNDRLASLQATEPELLATLFEIDRIKKALRGHSPAAASSCSASNVSGLPRHMVSHSDSSGSEHSMSLDVLDWTLQGCGELVRPGPQRTLSAGTRTLKPLKAAQKTLCPRNPVTRTNLTDVQKQQQHFLNRRAALYNPARPTSSESFVSDDTTKSRRRRHNANTIEVSDPESRYNYKFWIWHDCKFWICMVCAVLHITWLLTLNSKAVGSNGHLSILIMTMKRSER